jgi:TRAP-type C4-dicarboxylate transport system substrate-binding protein
MDTNIGCSAYCLMANDGVWAEITKNGYADAIKSVSGDYLLNLVGIWEAYEAKGRESAAAAGGVIYAPDGALSEGLHYYYDKVAEKWVSDTGGSAKQVYDQTVTLVDKYNAQFD